MRDLFHLRRALADKQPGQILVILALAMVGLLVAAGLAVDGGVLFVRKSQLDRATDAAALAGVVTLADTDSVDEANNRGLQLMGANNVILTQSAVEGCSSGWEATYDYCGEEGIGNVPGSVRYSVQVEWEAQTYFMGLVGFGKIPLRSRATADYFTLVDMFANSLGGQGIVRASNQSIFGPDSCTNNGDAYTPYVGNLDEWSELEGAYTYRVSIPATYSHDKLRVEIFDPDTGNPKDNTSVTVFGVQGTSNTQSCTPSQYNTCLLDPPWSGGGDNPNPYWFRRVDETRTPCSPTPLGECSCSSVNCQCNTITLYRLYYLKQNVDGTLEEVDLAYYIGKQWYGATATEAANTDMMWVSPGSESDGERLAAFNNIFAALDAEHGGYSSVSPDLSSVEEPDVAPENCNSYRLANPAFTNAAACSGDGNFIVDLTSEVPDIFTSGSGQRDLYLEVRGLDESSENGFEFWAGPPPSAGSDFVVPAEINARQTYILAEEQNGRTVHDSEGVGVFGMGHLPMNTNDDIPDGVEIALAYIGPELAGQELTVEMFDSDAGAIDPILFYFDTIPTEDWAACYDDDLNGNGDRSSGPGEGLDYSPTNNENPCYPNSWCLVDSCDSWGYTRVAGIPADIPHSNYWTNPPFTFTIPSDDTGVPFYGGRLMVLYRSGSNDTFGWKLTLKSRPFLSE